MTEVISAQIIVQFRESRKPLGSEIRIAFGFTIDIFHIGMLGRIFQLVEIIVLGRTVRVMLGVIFEQTIIGQFCFVCSKFHRY